MLKSEGMVLKTTTTLRTFDGDIEAWRRQFGVAEGERRFYANHEATSVRVIEGNVALQEGIVALFNLLSGAAEAAFSNANAYIGVGDDNTAAADTQTGLQAAVNKLYKGMEATYPQVGAAADKKITFRSSFGDAEANFDWEEWTVASGNSDAADNLNRKVESLGTKASGTWQLTVDITAA